MTPTRPHRGGYNVLIYMEGKPFKLSEVHSNAIWSMVPSQVPLTLLLARSETNAVSYTR